VQRLQADLRRSAREAEQLKMKLALGGSSTTGSGAGADDSQDVNGVKLIARRLAGLEKGALRGLSDSLRDRLGSGVVVLASENDGKVALVVSVTKDLTSKVQAGRLVKELAPIVGGGGGGRPDFAEAGGKDPAGIDALPKYSNLKYRIETGQCIFSTTPPGFSAKSLSLRGHQLCGNAGFRCPRFHPPSRCALRRGRLSSPPLRCCSAR
jgi:hypothetical protein